MAASSSNQPNSLLPTPSPPVPDDFIKKGEEKEKQILLQLESLPLLPFSNPNFLISFPAHKPTKTLVLEAISPPDYKDTIVLKVQGKYLLIYTQNPAFSTQVEGDVVDIFLLEVGGNAIEVNVAMGNIRCRMEVEIVVKTMSNFPPVLFD